MLIVAFAPYLHDQKIDVAVVLAEADAINPEDLGEDSGFLRGQTGQADALSG